MDEGSIGRRNIELSGRRGSAVIASLPAVAAAALLFKQPLCSLLDEKSKRLRRAHILFSLVGLFRPWQRELSGRLLARILLACSLDTRQNRDAQEHD